MHLQNFSFELVFNFLRKKVEKIALLYLLGPWQMPLSPPLHQKKQEHSIA